MVTRFLGLATSPIGIFDTKNKELLHFPETVIEYYLDNLSAFVLVLEPQLLFRHINRTECDPQMFSSVYKTLFYPKQSISPVYANPSLFYIII